MLNRNDRISLRRNRSAVTWLTFITILLGIWILNLRRDVSSQQEDYNILLLELTETQHICKQKNNTIDSLNKIINFKPVDTAIDKKVYSKPVVVKKDTTTHRIDTNKRIILKDTLKSL